MGVIRVEEEKFRLPVDVGGSKTSVLKLSINNMTDAWTTDVNLLISACLFAFLMFTGPLNHFPWSAMVILEKNLDWKLITVNKR